ncbi:MAG: flavin reductase [Cellvibrionaceae bacterium]|nr:flavin reductase [Cellvibrionaceae bacterium]|tara:strand:+ start:6504 stop:6998 length:495 start_codon:yes stop_codon:yes gene_type:complete
MKSVEMGDAMKEGMRRLASGVCVISSRDSKGEAHAMTATSVTSVSDSPASLLVCINKSTRMYTAMQQGADFCVNLLGCDQEAVSNRCSSGDQNDDRFDEGNWLGDQAIPYLDDALGVFFCRQAESMEFGTHRIVVGEITSVMVAEGGSIDPLIYLNGSYGKVAK